MPRKPRDENMEGYQLASAQAEGKTLSFSGRSGVLVCGQELSSLRERLRHIFRKKQKLGSRYAKVGAL